VKIYLAGPYATNADVKQKASELRELGHKVVSTWHEHGRPEAKTAVEMRNAAYIDLDDLQSADAILCFTQPSNASPFSSGGRHVEFGVALGVNQTRLHRPDKDLIKLLVVGPTENVYYSLHGVHHFRDWEHAKAELKEMA